MSDPLDDLYWRDEILQILYWLRGEGLIEAVAPDDILTFLDASEDLVRSILDRLVEEGYVVLVDGFPERYQLTPLGVKEGGRRFAEEFADYTHQGHGECNDPDCFCKTEGPEACVIRTTHKHSA